MKNFIAKFTKVTVGSLIGMVSFIAANYAAASAHGWTVSVDWQGAIECYGYVVVGLLAVELGIGLIGDLRESLTFSKGRKKVALFIKDGNVMGR